MTKMDKCVERQVRDFYDNEGWVTDGDNVPTETKLFRELKGGRAGYGEKVGQQLKRLLQEQSGTLMIVGGGDVPDSHVNAAAHFEKVICLDISKRALAHAERRFGERGEYHLASAIEMPLPDKHVDAVLCAHMLYHVDKAHQSAAVDEMIRVTKAGGRVLVVYLNPNSPLMLIQRFLKALRINQLLGKAKLYVFGHPKLWWQQFNDRCQIEILPNNAISTNQAKALLPVVSLRQRFFKWAGRFEDRRPEAAARLWTYISIVLDKKE